MAYVATNPPQLLVPSIGGKPAIWAYRSTHTSTEVLASGFFANGSDLGMKPGDFLLTTSSTGFLPFLTGVSTVTASSAATVVGSTGA
jgi:hypothetical protein